MAQNLDIKTYYDEINSLPFSKKAGYLEKEIISWQMNI